MRAERREERRPANVPGLSTAHISTLSHALIWEGGSKIKVSRNHPDGISKGGGLRGKITEFSKGSRRRFMLKLAEVDRAVLPLFCGLTFPDEYFDHTGDPAHWKICLKRFIERFKRRFPSGSFFWRLELMPRKSGKHVGQVFPHFHLIVYGVDYADLLGWLSAAWYESCGKLSLDHLIAGTRVEKIANPRHLSAYVSKYMAKPAKFTLEIGRVWGVVRIELIPWVRALLCQLTENEAVRLIRYLRRFAHLRSRDYKSLTVLVDAHFWYVNLDRILYP